MALDPSIILHAGDALKALPNYGDVMEQRARVQARQQALAEHNQDQADAAQQKQVQLATQQRRVSLGAMAAGGDLEGADKAALAAGDFDLHNTIKGLQAEQRAKTRERAQAIGQAALYADTPEKWDAAIDQLVQSGHPDVAEYKGKFSPEAREAAINSARSVEDAFKSHEEQNKPYTLSPGEQRFSGNKMVASVAPQKKFVLDQETGQVVQLGGDGVAPGAPGISGKPVANGRAAIEGIFPGVHVTDNLRDPNSKLGRANPNSWHNKSGGAVDVRPIPGMSFDEYVAGIKQAGYSIIEARDEVTNPSGHATGPHWHVVIGAQGQAPPRRGKPPSAYEWGEGGSLKPIKGGPADKEAALPKIPSAVMKDFTANRSAIRLMGEAKKAVEDYKGAVGAWNYATPDAIAQRTDPKGVNARSLIANIGSQIIHDRSGAAVTISEYPRLKPFIPLVTDTPATIGKKLDNLKRVLSDMNADIVEGYSNDEGKSQLDRMGAAPVMTPEQVRNSPSGTRYRTTDGREGVRP